MPTKIYNSPLLTALDTETQEPVFIGVDHHGAVKTVAPQQFRVHSGEAYTSGFFWDGTNPIAGAATVQLLISPVVGAHFIASFSSTGGFDLFFYKDTIVSANGNLQGNLNKNEFSSNTSALAIYEGPTVTDKGTLMGGTVLPEGGIFGGGGGSGSAFGSEFILNPVRNYMLEALNDSGGNLELSVSFEWYEPS